MLAADKYRLGRLNWNKTFENGLMVLPAGRLKTRICHPQVGLENMIDELFQFR